MDELGLRDSAAQGGEKRGGACQQCPRRCGRRGALARGYCGVGEELEIGGIYIHPWEEPPISGQKGSGAIFFAGCNLRCIFCQNQEISRPEPGRYPRLSPEGLLDKMLELAACGVHNIQFVTASHYIQQLEPVLRTFKARCPQLPLAWNSSGYESVESLARLEGLIDIYLCDFKYYDNRYARRYSGVADYRERLLEALAEMRRQCPEPEFTQDGVLKRGLILRHLQLPGLYFDSRKILHYLGAVYGESIILSLMGQYTPLYGAKTCPEIDRKLRPREYEKLLELASGLPFAEIYAQELDSAEPFYVPPFEPERALEILRLPLDSSLGQEEA